MSALHDVFGELRSMTLGAPTPWDEIVEALLPYEHHEGFVETLAPYCRQALGGRRDCQARPEWVWDALEGTERPILSVCTSLALPKEPRDITAQDLKRLLENHDLHLHTLDLSGQGLGTHGMEVLSASADVRASVETLILRDAGLENASLAALSLRPWPQVETLTLSENDLTDLGAVASRAQAWPRLTTLRAFACGLEDAGVVALAQALALPALEMLGVDGFHYDETAEALGAHRGLRLMLSPGMWCGLSQAAVATLEDAGVVLSPRGRVRWSMAQERGRQETRRRNEGGGRRRRRRRRR